MDNLFVFSVITVVVVNLRFMIKILDKKMLKGIHLYWLYNNGSEKINSLTGHSNQSWINKYKFITPTVK